MSLTCHPTTLRRLVNIGFGYTDTRTHTTLERINDAQRVTYWLEQCPKRYDEMTNSVVMSVNVRAFRIQVCGVHLSSSLLKRLLKLMQMWWSATCSGQNNISSTSIKSVNVNLINTNLINTNPTNAPQKTPLQLVRHTQQNGKMCDTVQMSPRTQCIMVKYICRTVTVRHRVVWRHSTHDFAHEYCTRHHPSQGMLVFISHTPWKATDMRL